MRFTLFFLPALALASPLLLEPRADNAGKILAKLKMLNTDVGKENTTLNSFPDNQAPPVNTVINLQNGATQINYDINNATKFCNSSSVATASESTQIYNYLKNTLLPSTTDLINNFIAHYPGLNPTYGSIVHDDLVQTKDNTDILGKCLVKKSSGSAKTNAPALLQKFDAIFQKGINKYA